jgi:hypothetical protein
VINFNNIKYNVLIVNVSTCTQVTINSKNIWELKKGKLDGLRFRANDFVLLNLKRFMELNNKIIIFSNKPYKVLKVLNESEVEDVSLKPRVYDFGLVHDLKKIKEILEGFSI